MQPRVALAEAFAAVYDIIALAFLEGPKALRAAGASEDDPPLALWKELEPEWFATISSMLSRDGNELSVADKEFQELLVIPIPGRYVPPYASVHLDGRLWGPSTLEVVAIFQGEGLVWERLRPGYGEARIFAPDHIGVELAFISVLSRRNAMRGSSLQVSEALESILGHFVAWVPLFQKAVFQMELAAAPETRVSNLVDFALEVARSDRARRRSPA